ncbi:MAG: TolC family protein [Archangiaceae bacterium]|nr:TolC family protein [Archangiaceae bacterium]
MYSLSVAVLVLAAAPTTLEQALTLGPDGNAELRVSRSEVEVARASVPLAHDWEMPKLRLQFNDAQAVPSGSFTWFTGISWRPPNPWEWSNGASQAELKVRQAELDLAAQTWRVVRDVRLGWLDVSGAAAHEALARRSTELRGKLRAVMQRRMERGGSTQVEVNLAQLAETDARQDVARWEANRLKATASVAWLVGQPVAPIPLTLPDTPPELPSLATLLDRLERHPHLESLRLRVEAGRAGERLVGAKRLPWPELQLRLRQKTGETPVQNDLQVGLTIPLGITPAPQVDVARAQVVRAQAQYDAEHAQQSAELEILMARAQGLTERWRSFESEYRATMTSHLALQARVLADDSLDPTLLMTADRQAIELEHKRLDVQVDLAKVLVELEGTAGPARPTSD